MSTTGNLASRPNLRLCAARNGARDFDHSRDHDLHTDAQQKKRRTPCYDAGAFLAEQPGHRARPLIASTSLTPRPQRPPAIRRAGMEIPKKFRIWLPMKSDTSSTPKAQIATRNAIRARSRSDKLIVLSRKTNARPYGLMIANRAPNPNRNSLMKREATSPVMRFQVERSV